MSRDFDNKVGDGIQCPKCKEKIYSEYTHDFHYCGCGYCFVDGGFEYLRYGWGPGEPKPKIVKRSKEQTSGRKTSKTN